MSQQLALALVSDEPRLIPTPDPRSAMAAAVPGFRVVLKTFDVMEIAEEELARAGINRTGRDCFLALRAPESFHGLADWLYRAHARELCERARDGYDLRPGTVSEVIAGLHAASLIAPLSSDGTGLQFHCFLQVLDMLGMDRPSWALDDWREPWEGAREDLLSDARRSTRQEWRKR